MNGIDKKKARQIMSGMFGSAPKDEEEDKKPKTYQRISNMLAGKKG